MLAPSICIATNTSSVIYQVCVVYSCQRCGIMHHVRCSGPAAVEFRPKTKYVELWNATLLEVCLNHVLIFAPIVINIF